MNALSVQEVQFDHVVAPIVQDGVKLLSQVFANLRIVDIQDECNAPAAVADDEFSVVIAHEPVRMLPDDLRGTLGDKRGKPDSRLIPLCVNFICQIFHAMGEFGIICRPVTDSGFKAVINLENGDLILGKIQSIQVI